MKLEELRHELTELANTGTSERADVRTRLAGVDAHAAADRRRARLAIAGAVAAVGVVAALTVPLADFGSDETVPAQNPREEGVENPGVIATDLPTVDDKGTTFYAEPGGGRLVGHVVSEPGARRVSLTFVPATLDLRWSEDCWFLRGADGSDAITDVEVNGRPLSGGQCAGQPSGPVEPSAFFGNGSPASNRAGWRAMGVEVGKPTTITMTVRKVPGGSLPQLALGVWAAPPRSERDGVWYDDEVVDNGRAYRAQEIEVSHFAHVPYELRVPLVESEDRVLVAFGSEGLTGRAVMRASGNSTRFGAGVSDGAGSSYLAGTSATDAFVRMTSPAHPDTSGTVYLIQYTLIN